MTPGDAEKQMIAKLRVLGVSDDSEAMTYAQHRLAVIRATRTTRTLGWRYLKFIAAGSEDRRSDTRRVSDSINQEGKR